MTNQQIQETFSGLFTNRTEEQLRADAAQMLSFRFLSDIERIMADRGLTKRKLAEAVGTSPSYITQLFRGDRLLNIDMMARFEQVLNIRFALTDNDEPAAQTSPKRLSRTTDAVKKGLTDHQRVA